MFKAITDLMGKPTIYQEVKEEVKKEEVKEAIEEVKEEVKEAVKEEVKKEVKRRVSDLLISFFLKYLGCSNKRTDVMNPLEPVEIKVVVEVAEEESKAEVVEAKSE